MGFFSEFFGAHFCRFDLSKMCFFVLGFQGYRMHLGFFLLLLFFVVRRLNGIAIESWQRGLDGGGSVRMQTFALAICILKKGLLASVVYRVPVYNGRIHSLCPLHSRGRSVACKWLD